MGFTIEDMLVVSQNKYKMKFAAGKNGWSNSISWMLMVEDTIILEHFSGKELAITTGLGFATEEKMLDLTRILIKHHAAGLVVNTGYYVHEIPQVVLDLCNESDFPILTVPWEVKLSEMVKDLSMRIYLQGAADEQISKALMNAISNPEKKEKYWDELLPYFDVDGTFQIALITTGDLDKMDTVERRRISYSFQIYLENLSHNGNFFYYDSFFVVVANAVPQEGMEEIIQGFLRRAGKRMPEYKVYAGLGSQVTDITNLRVAYMRARAAARMAMNTKKSLVRFDEMGINRLLYLVDDERLLTEMSDDLLKPLLEHDKKHDSEYTETLEAYLRYNGSIQAVSEELYTHRNTVIYRVNNIKKKLKCKLETPEERLPYQIACLIRKMRKTGEDENSLPD